MTGILVIEDNQDIAELVRLHLSELTQDITLCDSGLKGLTQALTQHYDLIVLDLMLPGIHGLDICQQVRSQDTYTPILMLTSLDDEADRVNGLELGADDYLTKPFGVAELKARVKALLRRIEAMAKKEPEDDGLCFGDLQINASRREVLCGSHYLNLTLKEFDLLYYMAAHPNKPFSRQQLLDAVWGCGFDGFEHTVNSHINRLRAKLEPDPNNPRHIQTVWGLGYKFYAELSAPT